MEPCSLNRRILSILPAPDWRDLNLGVALSGGADSTALLRLLADLKQEIGGRGEIVALHVNHRLRGAAAEEDQAWCEALCRKLGVRCISLQVDVIATAAADGDGLEAAARKQRYAMLAEAAHTAGLRYVTTAHTQDDQVETILFRLLRGTGLRGLGGISATRLLAPTVTLVRPLLGCTRREIESYLESLGQDFRIDASNTSREFTRNRIRNELLPLLRRDYNAAIDDILLRLASQASQAQEQLEGLADEVLVQARTAGTEGTGESGELRLHLAAFVGKSPVVVREALRLAWREAQLPEQAMTFDSWNELADLVQNAANGTSINLPGAIRARRENDLLILEW